ncbi:MAG: helix-turn-helix transcriptional regulator [Firmicutes bacterium]|nr:helix-turn-helix transcriptional regulator [Bacillota bacterium]
MKARGIDEKEMAARMNITPPTIKRFLNGVDQSRYSADSIIKFAKALDVSPNVIIHRDYQ